MRMRLRAVGVVASFATDRPGGFSEVDIEDLRRLVDMMGAVAEAECRRIIAAFDHAEQRGLPVEWVALSAGAQISMDRGTENMDWCAAVVRRILEFTQRGGEVVVIVSGMPPGTVGSTNSIRVHKIGETLPGHERSNDED